MDPTAAVSASGPHVAPMSRSDPAFHDPALDELVRVLGYHPHALLTMARKPGLLPAILGLLNVVVWSEGAISTPLRLLLACEASRGAGCLYTAAHVVHAAHHAGVGWDKLAALPDYGRDPLFTTEERHALAIATAGSALPVADARAAFDEAKQVFNDDGLIEIVSAVSAFGWFNRWNSLMRTELEAVPAEALDHVPWLAALSGRIT